MPLIIDKTDPNQINAVAAEEIHPTEQREKLILILPQIASEVTTAIRAANLAIPIFFMIPTTGDTLLTFATPADPTDADWDHASEIIRRIVEAKIGVGKLVTRPVHCISSEASIGAADVITDVHGTTPEP
jgi:hypothetical protein